MKKIICLISILWCGLSLSISANSLLNDNQTTIEPRASYVFNSVGSAINKSAYGGNATLISDGSGTVTITLQKYASASNSWVALDGPYSKSFSNTTVPGYTRNRILSTKGKYRCKTTVKATVGSHTDTRTVYSGTLTIN